MHTSIVRYVEQKHKPILLFFRLSLSSNFNDNTDAGGTNVFDDGNNIWNISKTPGTNIIGGPYLGGNYWSDYTGFDTNDDGLGDTDVPHGLGDYLPLVSSAEETTDINQSNFDRGFPIRHALDGDWAGAQSFIPTLNTFTSTEIYMR